MKPTSKLNESLWAKLILSTRKLSIYRVFPSRISIKKILYNIELLFFNKIADIPTVKYWLDWCCKTCSGFVKHGCVKDNIVNNTIMYSLSLSLILLSISESHEQLKFFQEVLLVLWPIRLKFRTREQATKPQTNYCCCLRFNLTSTSSAYSVLLNFVTKLHFVRMPLSPSRQVNMADSRWMEGSGRAIKKWGKTIDFVSCFPLHFFRALPLPACFTTEQSTVEASLFVKCSAKIQNTNSIQWRFKT